MQMLFFQTVGAVGAVNPNECVSQDPECINMMSEQVSETVEKLDYIFSKMLGIGGSKEECLQTYEQYRHDSTLRELAEAVGSKKKFCELPVLPWKKEFETTFNHISIDPKDMTVPLMRGVDPNGRAFLAAQLIALKKNSNPDLQLYSKEYEVVVLFQRYADASEPWAISTFKDTYTYRPNRVKAAINDLKTLIGGGVVENHDGRKLVLHP